MKSRLFTSGPTPVAEDVLLRRAFAAAETNDTPWTPAISLIAGLDAALERPGLRLFSQSPSFAVTPVWLVLWKTFQNALEIENGITIAGGQGEFVGRIFRLAHLGYYDELDMVTVVAALERALHRCRYAFEPGIGVAAVQRGPAIIVRGKRRSGAFFL